MLVNSFDTKYAKTAYKYELLDKNFIDLFSKNKKFNRIFTSVVENQELNNSSNILLRSDITGQVIDTILSSSACLFYSKKSIKKKGVKKILKLLSKN